MAAEGSRPHPAPGEARGGVTTCASGARSRGGSTPSPWPASIHGASFFEEFWECQPKAEGADRPDGGQQPAKGPRKTGLKPGK